jgi:hypothetical protein
MLPLKQIPRRVCTMISNLTLKMHNDYMLHGHAPQNYQLVDILGMMLLSLILLVVTAIFLVVNCISSLWYVILMMLQKWTRLCQYMDPRESMRRYTSWLSEAQQTVTLKTEKLSQNLRLKKVIVTPPGFMSTFSVTPGEHNPETGMPRVEPAVVTEHSDNIDEDLADRLRKTGM